MYEEKRSVIPLRDEVTRNKASNGLGVGKVGGPCPTLTTADIHSVFVYIIRRLTPVEGERLQGYPDDWTKYGADGNIIADTARYRAIGNSICVYCAERLYIGIIRILQEEEKDNERKDESLL